MKRKKIIFVGIVLITIVTLGSGVADNRYSTGNLFVRKGRSCKLDLECRSDISEIRACLCAEKAFTDSSCIHEYVGGTRVAR